MIGKSHLAVLERMVMAVRRAHHGFEPPDGEALRDARASPCPHASGAGRVVEHVDECACQRLAAPWLDQAPGYAVLHEFGQTTNACSDRGTRCRHRLGDSESEALEH